MLKTKFVNNKLSDLNTVKSLFFTLFPVVERVPFWFLLMKAKKNFVDFLAFYDEEDFAGFVYLITRKNLTLILYIAVNSTMQGKGYGSCILNYVKTLYPGNRFIIDIEAVNAYANNHEQRKKRRAFYIKNGYVPTGFFLIEKTEIYETLTHGGDCSITECQALIKKFTGRALYLLFKPKLSYLPTKPIIKII